MDSPSLRGCGCGCHVATTTAGGPGNASSAVRRTFSAGPSRTTARRTAPIKPALVSADGSPTRAWAYGCAPFARRSSSLTGMPQRAAQRSVTGRLRHTPRLSGAAIVAPIGERGRTSCAGQTQSVQPRFAITTASCSLLSTASRLRNMTGCWPRRAAYASCAAAHRSQMASGRRANCTSTTTMRRAVRGTCCVQAAMSGSGTSGMTLACCGQPRPTSSGTVRYRRHECESPADPQLRRTPAQFNSRS